VRLFKRGSDDVAEESTEWPAINELIWVRLPCCETAVHPSRVEDFENELLVVAHPSKPHPEPVPAPDTDRTFIIGWRAENTSKQSRVKLDAADSGGRVPVWKLRQTGKPEAIQRRRFVRAEWHSDVTIHFPATNMEGKIIDISEAGLRCFIDPIPEPRSPFFQISFTLNDERLVLETEIAWWGMPNFEGVEIGLQFVDPGRRINDLLRAFAYDQQLKNRKNQSH
jgi:hypothetical protein